MKGAHGGHVRLQDGRILCYFSGRSRHLRAELPPVCDTCGRTLLTGVWTHRAYWAWRRARRLIAGQRRRARKRATMKAGMIDWGCRCRDIRAMKGWTRRSLALAAGVSLRTVENWESGRNVPDRRARKVLEAFWIEIGGPKDESDTDQRQDAV